LRQKCFKPLTFNPLWLLLVRIADSTSDCELVAHRRKKLSGLPSSNESLVAQSLDRIAAILIRAGFDSTTAERLLRRAFIVAAAKTVKASSTKATQSQIASIAGVSRLEVRKFLGQTPRALTKAPPGPISRIESVISGWTSNAAFLSKSGKPRPLNFHGPESKFADLVRKYGRDVTPKTLRVQLVRLGYAAERGAMLHLLKQASAAGRVSAASADLRFIASQLANIDFELGRRAYLTRRVSVFARDTKSIRAMRRIAQTRLDTVLNSLASMSTAPEARKLRRRTAPHRLLVSSAIAIEWEDNK
jgi:hypothetical protein